MNTSHSPDETDHRDAIRELTAEELNQIGGGLDLLQTIENVLNWVGKIASLPTHWTGPRAQF